jgi:hypothetical protein
MPTSMSVTTWGPGHRRRQLEDDGGRPRPAAADTHAARARPDAIRERGRHLESAGNGRSASNHRSTRKDSRRTRHLPARQALTTGTGNGNGSPRERSPCGGSRLVGRSADRQGRGEHQRRPFSVNPTWSKTDTGPVGNGGSWSAASTAPARRPSVSPHSMTPVPLRRKLVTAAEHRRGSREVIEGRRDAPWEWAILELPTLRPPNALVQPLVRGPQPVKSEKTGRNIEAKVPGCSSRSRLSAHARRQAPYRLRVRNASARSTLSFIGSTAWSARR